VINYYSFTARSSDIKVRAVFYYIPDFCFEKLFFKKEIVERKFALL